MAGSLAKAEDGDHHQPTSASPEPSEGDTGWHSPDLVTSSHPFREGKHQSQRLAQALCAELGQEGDAGGEKQRPRRALHPGPAPPASPFSQEFTPAELLAHPAPRLAPSKSAFLLSCHQISVGIEFSRLVRYRPRASLPGGGQEPLLGAQHPPSPAPLVPAAPPSAESPRSLPTSTGAGDGRPAPGSRAQPGAPTSQPGQTLLAALPTVPAFNCCLTLSI